MMISPISYSPNFTGKQKGGFSDVVALTVFSLAAYAGVSSLVYREAKNGMSSNVEYVKEHAPQRYELLKEKYGTEPFYKGHLNNNAVWYRAANEVRDSLAVEAENVRKVEEALRLDSIAHVNYQRGMQAVRDSLAKVDSAKVTKMILK